MFRAERIFGYSASEIIGQSINILLPQGHEQEENRTIERIVRGESVKQFESRRKCKDGKLIDVSVTVSPILDTQGKVIGASRISRDITDRKAKERSCIWPCIAKIV